MYKIIRTTETKEIIYCQGAGSTNYSIWNCSAGLNRSAYGLALWAWLTTPNRMETDNVQTDNQTDEMSALHQVIGEQKNKKTDSWKVTCHMVYIYDLRWLTATSSVWKGKTAETENTRPEINSTTSITHIQACTHTHTHTRRHRFSHLISIDCSIFQVTCEVSTHYIITWSL